MKLYSVHCGFYDNETGDGIYESHINLFVAAVSFDEARQKVKSLDIFKNKRMHIDGLQEIQLVDGYNITLSQSTTQPGLTKVISYKHRDLAPRQSN